MSESLNAQIARAYRICKKLKLSNKHNENVLYKADLVKAIRDLSYREEWEYYVKNRLYNIMFDNYSLFQFKLPTKENPQFSYCYYECPLNIVPYEDFLISFDTNINEAGQSYREEYDDYVFTATLREHITPIRYDYAPKDYREGIHPAAHIHIGRDNHVRLGTERLMSPLSFVLFTLRQTNPHAWSVFLQSSEAEQTCRAVRDGISRIEAEFLKKMDKWEVMLA